MLEKSGHAWVRRSVWNANSLESLRPGTIVLLDTIGELASVYSLASVAFVGGSLVAAGGHNPLEPAQFGAPIVMGPHYANFTTITDALRAQNALRIAKKEDLAGVLSDLRVIELPLKLWAHGRGKYSRRRPGRRSAA